LPRAVLQRVEWSSTRTTPNFCGRRAMRAACSPRAARNSCGLFDWAGRCRVRASNIPSPQTAEQARTQRPGRRTQAARRAMFLHRQQLQHPVKANAPDAVYARKLQEVLGGQYGEITVAMQYSFQAWNAHMP